MGILMSKGACLVIKTAWSLVFIVKFSLSNEIKNSFMRIPFYQYYHDKPTYKDWNSKTSKKKKKKKERTDFTFSSQTIAVGCGPGTFLNSTALVCQKCPNGTFSAHENARMCSTCKRCMGRNNVMVKACTPTSDTKCECLPGHYFNGFLICLKCQPCKRGYGFVKNCTATTNTVCERCERVSPKIL